MKSILESKLSAQARAALAGGLLYAGCLFGLAGCSSDASSVTLSNENDTYKLAQASTKMGDRPGHHSPDVTNSTSIPYTVHIDGDSSKGEDGEAEPSEYTVEISIDPYLFLWSAKGTIIDIDYSTDLAVVRLTSYEPGHFATHDVLITYADYLTTSEYDLTIGSNISFQYLLTNPMHTPLQAYSITMV